MVILFFRTLLPIIQIAHLPDGKIVQSYHLFIDFTTDCKSLQIIQDKYFQHRETRQSSALGPHQSTGFCIIATLVANRFNRVVAQRKHEKNILSGQNILFCFILCYSNVICQNDFFVICHSKSLPQVQRLQAQRLQTFACDLFFYVIAISSFLIWFQFMSYMKLLLI